MLRFTFRTLKLIKLLRRVGIVNSTCIINSRQRLVKISPLFFNKSSFFKGVKLVSSPSKVFYVNLRSLQLLTKAVGETVIILSTSKGLLTHRQAIKYKLGGKILCIIN